LLLEQDEEDEADQQYKLAYQKGLVLKQEVTLYKERMKEEARQKAIEERAIREEEERSRLEAERKRQQELEEPRRFYRRVKGNGAAADAVPHPAQLTSYTVRRGETLPQIAARPELYNDMALWPLIYRANRDQIRDPYQLWPGQTLKIPRNFSREEALEARRQAHRRSP
jgi:nucleoid-associated protein YgaU